MKEKNVDVEKLLKNKLKAVSVGELEEKIAKVISELVGEDYNCTISDIKYSLFSGAEFKLKVELTYKEE
jgi:hypothetical protein